MFRGISEFLSFTQLFSGANHSVRDQQIVCLSICEFHEYVCREDLVLMGINEIKFTCTVKLYDISKVKP